MLIITNGSWFDLDNELEKPVFYLPRLMKERLKLKHTISVVYRDKEKRSLMRVDVHAIKKVNYPALKGGACSSVVD